MKNSFQINKIKQFKQCVYNIIMDAEFDTNINHWNEEDLLELFNLSDYNKQNINGVVNALIEKSNKDNNEKISQFLKAAKNKLLKSNGNEDWVDNQYLKQKNIVQADKITDRDNKVKIIDDGGHFQMKRKKQDKT